MTTTLARTFPLVVVGLTLTGVALAAVPSKNGLYIGTFDEGVKRLEIHVAADGKTATAAMFCYRQHVGAMPRFPITDGRFQAEKKLGSVLVWAIQGRFTSPTKARASVAMTLCDGKGGLVTLSLKSTTGASQPHTAAVTGATFHGSWRESSLSGVLEVRAQAQHAATLDLVLRQGQLVRQKFPTIRVAAGKTLRRLLKLQDNLLPGDYQLDVKPTGGFASQLLTVRLGPPPPEGVVDRSFASAVANGPPVTALPAGRQTIWAHFHFAVQPRKGLEVEVGWFQPGVGNIGWVGKPNAPSIVSFVSVGGGLRTGTWRAVLRAGGKIVKQVDVRIGG